MPLADADAVDDCRDEAADVLGDALASIDFFSAELFISSLRRLPGRSSSSSAM